MDERRDAPGAGGGLELAASTWEALLRAQVSLMRHFDSAGDFEPLSKLEYDVLYNLASAQDRRLRLRDLNELVLLAQPSLSRMADRLAAAGLLRRERAPDDARGTYLVLTEAGLDLQRRIGRVHVRSIEQRMTALSAAEQRTLRDLLRRLRTSTAI